MLRILTVMVGVSAFLFGAAPVISPVYAQQAVSDSFVVTSQAKRAEVATSDDGNKDDLSKRLELARQMHEIWPIRPKVENALDIAAQNFPEPERLSFKARMRQAVEFDALEQASIDAMVDIFTVEELQAMVAFYGSKAGRSVSHKTGDYEQELQPILVEMLDKALMDTRFGSSR